MKTPSPKLVQNTTTLNLVIPKKVEEKIRYLCSRVHDVEWSGTLFYSIEGSFDDGTFKATCLDICVMDIGSQGFTQYNDTADIINYRVNHPELLQEGVYEGLIHSHNNMSAFFSGTDSNTLLQEGADLNHFLSLIVCNNGPYVARVTRKLVKKVETEYHIVTTESSYYNTYDNVRVELSQDKVTTEEGSDTSDVVLVEWFNLNIHKGSIEEPFLELNQRLKDLRNKAQVLTSPPANYGKFVGKYQEPIGVERKTPAKNYEPLKESQGDLFPKYKQSYNNASGQSLPLPLVEGIDEEVKKSLCTQLLLGSIIVDHDKINLEKWVEKMDGLYARRFGSLDNEIILKRIEHWIEILVEQLITSSPDEDMETRVITTYGDEYDEDDFNTLYAFEMVRYLNTLPDSLVKQLIIDELTTYIPDELESYI